MEPELLKTKELPLLLNMLANKASELLAKHKIKPIDFGPGRGNGLRWLTREVRRLADTLHAEAQKKAGVPKRRRAHAAGCILGRSADELYNEMYGKGAVQN